MRIRKIKKIVVVLIIIAMLQTQIVSLTNVVWAVTAGIEEGGLGTELGGEISAETEVTEETPSVESEEQPEETPEDMSEEQPEETPEDMSEKQPEGNPEDISEEQPEETPEDIPEEQLEDKVVEPKIELNITSENSSIYKGYLYANATSELRYETNYNTIEELKIKGSENGITNLVVKEEEDKIKMITETKMALFNDIYYKKTRVSVEEFNSILGENGLINIFDADGDFVGYIDKSSTVENGYYVYEFIYYTNSVRYELSNPVADGTIRIMNDKAIKEDSLYSREQIATFSTINIMANAEMVVQENVLTTSGEGDINLQETESKIEIELDKTELSTEDENKLTMTLTLKTDAERYELFENPVMEIEMPSNVNELSIDGVNLLYKNGLSLKNWEVVEGDNGNKVLRIEIEGSQLVYTPGIVGQGTTLVVYLRANVNKLTANTSETMKLRYTNKDSVRQAYILEGKNSEELLLTFVAKHGMLKGMAAKNNTTLGVANSYEDEINKIEVKSKITEQTVTLTGTIVNNFEKDAEDVVILGRIPFIGNANEYGEEFQSDFDTTLNTEVLTSGNMTEIYYSEDGEASKDAETWTQDVTDISKYKSFKIVVKEGTLKNGERIEFTYDVKVPDNLGYNLKSYATYTVIYKLDNQELIGNSTIALVTEEKELDADDLEDKKEMAKLEIGTQVSQGGRVLTEEDTVYERQILRYTVVVTNPTDEVVTNVKLTGKAENANMYTWIYSNVPGYNGQEIFITKELAEDVDGNVGRDEMTIERLEPGESKIFEYQVITKILPEETSEEEVTENVEENETEVYGIITVSADNMEEQQIETIRNKVIDGELELRIGWPGTEAGDGTHVVTNAEFQIYLYAKNISDRNLKNVQLSIVIPEELELNENNPSDIQGAEGLEMKSEKISEGKKITFIIPNFQSGTEKNIYLSTLANSIDYTIDKKSIKLTASGEVEEKIYNANDYIKTVYQNETKLEHTWKSNVDKEYVEHDDKIEFELMVKNIGLLSSGSFSIDGKLPLGLRIEQMILVENNKETLIEPQKDSDGNLIIKIPNVNVDSKQNILLKIKTVVDEDYFKRDQETIDFKLSVFSWKIESFETEVISYKVNNKNVTILHPDDTEPEKPRPENPKEPKPGTSEEPSLETPGEPENTEPEAPNTQIPDDPIKEPEEEEKVIKTYIISGKVWLDSNKDGINRNEQGMRSVVVSLYKTTNKGNITSKVKDEITNENGEYKFTGVEEGTYVVVFNYDTSLYNSTKYKVSTATTVENSDAITKAVSINGTSEILGITDVITIKESGAINVDLGLVNKNEFDLELDKYIEKATVTNASGIKIYNYEEKENVKLEIHSKYFKDSKIDITYKIRIKNTGEVTGYVNRIADYVQEGMKFDNNKNPDWYYGDDGSLYYKGLIGQEIKAGETKEISLTLTKILEDGEATKVVNAAEIAESTNSMGLTDIDSTPGNKKEAEDDYGKVTLIITISTGKAVDNILIVILAVSTVVIIVYIAKFKITKKVYR